MASEGTRKSGGCSQSGTRVGCTLRTRSHPPPGPLKPSGTGQGLSAAGRRGPHSHRSGESSLQSPEASGGRWPGFLCSWVFLGGPPPALSVLSPHDLPQLGPSSQAQVTWCRSVGALGEGRAPGTAPGVGGLVQSSLWPPAHFARGMLDFHMWSLKFAQLCVSPGYPHPSDGN